MREPSSGEILFRGQPRGKGYKEKIGIQFQATALQDYMTVSEALETFAKLYNKSADKNEIIELCHLGEFLDRDHRKLSGGQRQRLLLALALINDPELIFLDEPTTGLDPQNRKNFWTLVENIKQKNKTIILTTHYMDEAYVLCDEIVIVDRGHIIAEGPPRRLLEKHYKGVKLSLPAAAPLPEDFKYECAQYNDRHEIHTEDLQATLQELIRAHVPLDSLEVRSATLEDLFIDLTGKDLRG